MKKSLKLMYLKYFSKERTTEFAKQLYEIMKNADFLNEIGKINIKQDKNGYILSTPIIEEDLAKFAVLVDEMQNNPNINENYFNELASNIELLQTQSLFLISGLYMLNGTHNKEAKFKLDEDNNETVYWYDFDYSNKKSNDGLIQHTHKFLGSYKSKIMLMDIFDNNLDEDISSYNNPDILNQFMNGQSLIDIFKNYIDNIPKSKTINDVFDSGNNKFDF